MGDPPRPVEVLPDGGRPAPIPVRPARRVAAAAVLAMALFWLALAPASPTPPVEWAAVASPGGPLHLPSLESTPGGFAVLSGPRRGGVLLWSSLDGRVWRPDRLPGAPHALVPAGDALIALAPLDAMVLESTSTGWAEAGSLSLPAPIRIGHVTGRAGLVAGPAGLLAQSMEGEVWWSGDSGRFRVSADTARWGEGAASGSRGGCSPSASSSLETLPVVARAEGFLALVSPHRGLGSWPVCEPQVWTSVDGHRWARGAEARPLGAGAYVRDVAARGDLMVAVGGTGAGPAAWRSEGGETWERISPPPAEHAYELRRVSAGEVGWVVLGRVVRTGRVLAWASDDATCWRPLPVAGAVAAVGGEQALVADGPPAAGFWVGSVEGGTMGCR